METENLDETKSSAERGKIAKRRSPGSTWASRIAKQVKWRAHWLLPNTVPPPNGREKAYDEQRDRESNESSRVPEDEELSLCVVWGVEFFGPAEVESLYEHLRRLNWTAGFRSKGENGALSWIRHQRAYGSGGSYNVGHVSERSDRKRFLMFDNYASMPEGVDHLLVRVFQLTPSLTSVLVGFVFKECTARTYERELNRDRKTVRERSERRWSISIIDPGHQKERSIQLARSKTRAMAQRWFADNLPGYFCSLSGNRMPTAELLTTRVHHLFSAEKGQQTSIRPYWRRMLSRASVFDVWTNTDLRSLRFAEDNDGWTKDTPHLTVSLCTSGVSEEAIKPWGGNRSDAYAAFCHERMDGVLSSFAAIAFLKEVAKGLKISRTALAFGIVGRRRTVTALVQIQKFFDRSLGTPAVVAELTEHSKHVGNYVHECDGFLSPSWRKDDAQRDLAVVLCENTQFLAAKIIGEEHSMREHFEQLSSVLSVRESVRAQKRMEWLTVVALVLASASLFAALPPMKDWPNTWSSLADAFSSRFRL